MHFRPPPLQSARLLDQVRERARYLHYSLRTEKAYVYWVRFFVRWNGLRHPRERIFNAMTLLLWAPAAVTDPATLRLLQRDLQTDATSFAALMRPYRELWARVN